MPTACQAVLVRIVMLQLASGTKTTPSGSSPEGVVCTDCWWRRGRVELPVQEALKGIYSRRSHRFSSYLTIPQWQGLARPA